MPWQYLWPLQMAERDDRPLLRRLLEVPDWRARYLANLREIATTTLTDEVIGRRIEDWRDAIADIVEYDAHSQRGVDAFEQEFATDGDDKPTANSLLGLIATRRKAILDDSAMTGSWPHVSDFEATYAVNRDGDPSLHVRCHAAGARIAKVRLHHDRGSFGAYDTTTMHDDGQHGDGAAGDGIYAGWLPKVRGGDTWRFWIEAVAEDSGHVDCLPAGGGALPMRWKAPKKN